MCRPANIAITNAVPIPKPSHNPDVTSANLHSYESAFYQGRHSVSCLRHTAPTCCWSKKTKKKTLQYVFANNCH